MSENLNLYKMGKYIRNVGILQLIGGLVCPIIIILVLISRLGLFTLYMADGMVIITGIFILASLVFLILMIVQGFLLSSASGNDKYKHFSILVIISYGGGILFSYLFSLLTKSALNNAVTGISSSLLSSTVNVSSTSGLVIAIFDMTKTIFNAAGLVFLIPPIIITVATEIILIFAWLRFKSALGETSDDNLVHKAINGTKLMITAIIFEGILSTLGFISIYLLFIDIIVTAVFFIAFFAFLIVQMSAYIVIGQNIAKYMRRYE